MQINHSISPNLSVQPNPQLQPLEERNNAYQERDELIAKIRLLPEDETELFRLCDSYEQLLQSPLLDKLAKRELFKEITFLLKRFSLSRTEVNCKLVTYLLGFCELGSDMTREVRVLIHVHAYQICIDFGQRQDIACKLASMLDEIDLMKAIKSYSEVVSHKEVSHKEAGKIKEGLEKLRQAAVRGLGESITILRRSILQGMNGAIRPGDNTRIFYQILNELFKDEKHVFFPDHLQNRLKELRSSFEIKLTMRFPDTSLKKVDPTQVRELQREISNEFTQFLQDLTALPCLLFEHNKLPAEILVAGSLAREEVYPFSDVEGMILFDDCADSSRSQEQQTLLRNAVEYISLLVAGIGETEALPIEVQPLIEHQKGFALDALFARPLAILEELNRNLQILLATPGQLLTLQKESSPYEETRLALYSLLKTRKIVSSSQGCLDYEEPLQKLLDETIEGKLRKQQIALQMIQEIHMPHYRKYFGFEGSQGWVEKPLESHDTIDIKEHFIKTLFHALTTLSIYHGINNTNILDIIDALAKQKQPVFTTESTSLLKEAVSAIFLLRLKMQLAYMKNPWKGKYDEAQIPPKTNPKEIASNKTAYQLEEEEYPLLKKAYWLVLRPLYYSVQQLAEENISLHAVNLADVAFSTVLNDMLHEKIKPSVGVSFIQCFVKHLVGAKASDEEHLNHYRQLSTSVKYEPLRKSYLESLNPSHEFLIQRLALIRNRDGFQQARCREENQLLQDIQAMGQSSSRPQQSSSDLQVEMVVPVLGTVQLKSEIVNELFDPVTGALNPYSTQNPQEKEYQNCRHTVRSISEHALHIKELPDHPCMEYAAYSLMHRLFEHGSPPTQLVRINIAQDSKKGSYPALISRTVSGKAFDPEIDSVNPIHLTELLISHILLLPGDANSRNFIFRDSALTCIDNDVGLVDPVVVKEERFSTTRHVQFTSILFCLKKDFFLDQQIIGQFCEADPLLVLNGWLNDLMEREKSYAALFPEVKEREKFLEKKPENAFTPFFLLASGSIARLYEQMIQLQSRFRERRQKRWTPFELLNELIGRSDQTGLKTTEIGAHIRSSYQNASQRSAAVERLRLAVGRDVSQSMTSSQSFEAQIGKVPSSEELEKRQLFSPEQGLKELFALNFERCTELGMIVHEKGQANFKSAFQKMVKEGQPDLERQRLVLTSLFRYLPESTSKIMSSLNLSHCAVLDDQGIEKLVSSYPELEVLDLRHCPLITSQAIQLIAERLKNLKELYISGCSKITALEVNQGLFRAATPLIFEKLVILHASHCPLARLQVKADQLTELKITGNSLLSTLSLSLSNLEIFHGSRLIDFSFITSLKTLKKLVLNRSYQMSNEQIDQIMKNNPLLSHLELHNCSVTQLPEHPFLKSLRLSDVLVQKLEDNYPALTTLDLKHCYKLEDIHLSSPQLEQLIAEDCWALKQLHFNSEKLKKLSLRGSPKAVVSGDLLFKHKTLEFLDVSGNNNLLIQDIKAIPSELPHLQELYLNRCYSIQNSSLVFDKPFPRLKVLHIDGGGLKSLSVEGDDIIEVNIKNNPDLLLTKDKLVVKNLKVIHLTGCDRITWNLLNELKSLPQSALKIFFLEITANTNLDELIAGLLFSGKVQFRLFWEKQSIKMLLKFLQVFPNQVTELNLSFNQLGYAGAQALAEALPSTKVTELILAGNGIEDVGAQALAEALPRTQVLELNLSFNQLGYAGAQALAEALPSTKVTELILAGNDIEDAGAQALAGALPSTQITELNLKSNQIGDAGAQALAEALPRTQIAKLNLRSNQIGAAGVQALAAALPYTQVTELDLGWDQIGDAGAQALAKALPRTQVTVLYLYCSKSLLPPGTQATKLELRAIGIGKAGAKALEDLQKLHPHISITF